MDAKKWSICHRMVMYSEQQNYRNILGNWICNFFVRSDQATWVFATNKVEGRLFFKLFFIWA